MDSLAYKKVKAQLLATQAAKADLEVRIEERRDEIRRIEEHILLQEKRELDLIAELKKLEET